MDHDVKQNYYDVLNLPVGFQNKDLKANYRALSLQYHPDKQPHVRLVISLMSE